jgi:hypothetical protein
MNGARDLACGRVRAAFRLERAGLAVVLALRVDHRAFFGQPTCYVRTIPLARDKLTTRLKPRTEVSAHLARRPRTASFEALHPLDGRGLAHPEARRSRPPAHPSPNHRVDHPIAQSCEYAPAIPAGLRPASRLNQSAPDSGIPRRFKLAAARSRRDGGGGRTRRRGADRNALQRRSAASGAGGRQDPIVLRGMQSPAFPRR